MSAPPPPPRRARAEQAPADGTAPIGPPPRRTDNAATGPTAGSAPRRTQVVVPPSPTRAQRQSQGGAAGRAAGRAAGQPNGRSGGPRWALFALLGVLVVGAAAFFVLKKDSTENAGPQFKASTAVDLQAGEATVSAVGNPVEFPADVRDQVLTTLGAYVETGVVAPLRQGKADDAALATAFDPAAITRLSGADRALVLDEGLPKAVGKVSVTTPPVPLNALVDRDGKVVAISAGVQLAVNARAAKGTVQINRTGSFVLAPDAGGAWRITGWTLSTDRGGPGVTPAPAGSDSTTTTVAP